MIKSENELPSKLITLDEAIERAKNFLQPQIDKGFLTMPARITISKWAQDGVISRKIKRENFGKKGGMRDLYPPFLFAEIAAAIMIKTNLDEAKFDEEYADTYAEPSKKLISYSRELAETIIFYPKECTITDVLKLHVTLRYSRGDERENIKKKPNDLSYVIRDVWAKLFLKACFDLHGFEDVLIVIKYNPETNKFKVSPEFYQSEKEEEPSKRGLYEYEKAIDDYLSNNPQCAELVQDLLGNYKGFFEV